MAVAGRDGAGPHLFPVLFAWDAAAVTKSVLLGCPFIAPLARESRLLGGNFLSSLVFLGYQLLSSFQDT